MSIRFTCPQCEARVEAPDTAAGVRAECPRCRTILMVPRQGIHAGMRIGEFEVKRRIGTGGMGEVWLAHQSSMDRHVALKILAPALTRDPEFLARFQKEVRLLAHLDHPNIVTAYTAGVEGDLHYLATAYVDGEELDARLRRAGPFAEAEGLRIARAVADALGYAWGKFRLLHRDIKPANIMLTADGEVRLMDLGISKSLREDSRLTMTGHFTGTPQYMSPEQVRDAEAIDCRSDIYSLGATLYHLLTGSPPFEGGNFMGILTQVLSREPPSPRTRNPKLSAACCALVGGMMAKSAADRPAAWEDLLRDLDRVMRGEVPRGASRKSATSRIPGADGAGGKPLAVKVPAHGPAPAAKPATAHGAAPRESHTPAVAIATVLAGLLIGGLAIGIAAHRRSARAAAAVAAPPPAPPPAAVAPVVVEPKAP